MFNIATNNRVIPPSNGIKDKRKNKYSYQCMNEIYMTTLVRDLVPVVQKLNYFEVYDGKHTVQFFINL